MILVDYNKIAGFVIENPLHLWYAKSVEDRFSLQAVEEVKI